jgi:hypothetical protein
VFQFYPSTDDQIQLITSIAQKAGFGGGIVVDYPNSKKARKVFLCLFVGGGGAHQPVPKGLEGEGEAEAEKIKFERRREREKRRERSGKRKTVKVKDWILRKKEVKTTVPLVSRHSPFRLHSCTVNVARRACPEIRNSLDASAERYFNIAMLRPPSVFIQSSLDVTSVASEAPDTLPGHPPAHS